LQTFDPIAPELSTFGGVAVVRQPLDSRNNGEAVVWGIETVLEGKISSRSRIQFWHVYQHLNTSLTNGSIDQGVLDEEMNNPLNQLALRGQFDIFDDIDFNPMVRFVENVPAVGASSFWQVDAQVAWRPRPDLRISLNGVNLLNDSNQESLSEFIFRPVSEIERAYFVGVTYQF
jgi:iron complex outermembrane receptor protein